MFARNFENLWKSKNFVDIDISTIPNEYYNQFGTKWNSQSPGVKISEALKNSGLPLTIYKQNGATYVSYSNQAYQNFQVLTEVNKQKQGSLSASKENKSPEEESKLASNPIGSQSRYQLVARYPPPPSPPSYASSTTSSYPAAKYKTPPKRAEPKRKSRLSNTQPEYQLIPKSPSQPLAVHIRGSPQTMKVKTSLHDTFYATDDTETAETFSQKIISSEEDRLPNSGLLGISENQPLYLNTDSPFCACICGLQGSGKSHTACTLIENCMLPFPEPLGREVVRLRQPMAGLILHYDQMESNICESAGLALFQPSIHFGVQSGVRVVVLVSPSYYLQRKNFYKEPYTVIPLMFKWESLDATQLRSLMRLDANDDQLYISVMLSQLREYQRAAKIPSFDSFWNGLKAAAGFSRSQSCPLDQRVEILREFVYESEKNANLRGLFQSVKDLFSPGTLVLADLTDPMLAPTEATAVFQVLLQHFRQANLNCGKLLVCDEAHKYFNKSEKCGFTKSITESVRLMRHEGLRVIVSSQSPEKIPTELLELSNMTILHNFISIGWFNYLKGIYKLTEEDLDTIINLRCGEALIHSRSFAGEFKKFNIRQKLTLDYGASKLNDS